MRKSDLELLEMRLEPHGVSIDRLTADMGQWLRAFADLKDRVKDLERDKEAHSTSIAQGLASVRSMLQRNNKAVRALGELEEEEVAPDEPEVNVPATRDDIIRAARLRHGKRHLL